VAFASCELASPVQHGAGTSGAEGLAGEQRPRQGDGAAVRAQGALGEQQRAARASSDTHRSQLKLTSFPSLPPLFEPSPNAAEELALARASPRGALCPVRTVPTLRSA